MNKKYAVIAIVTLIITALIFANIWPRQVLPIFVGMLVLAGGIGFNSLVEFSGSTAGFLYGKASQSTKQQKPKNK